MLATQANTNPKVLIIFKIKLTCGHNIGLTEGKIPKHKLFQVDLGVFDSKLVVLNGNMKALTEAMVSNLTKSQINIQYQSKLDEDKTLALSIPDGNT